MPFEKSLIAHCSPTLASLKPASLFNFSYETEEELEESLTYWNAQMKEKGVRLFVLKKQKQKALIYVYRVSRLEKELKDRRKAEFLNLYGYAGLSVEEALGHLKERLGLCEEFPHEIGVFLGYPLEDVVGFIENTGKNFRFAGLWKVYGNLDEAMRTFGKYKKCTDIYLRLWNDGRTVRQLTVAV